MIHKMMSITKEELQSLSDSIQFQKDMLTKANQELDYRSLRVKGLNQS